MDYSYWNPFAKKTPTFVFVPLHWHQCSFMYGIDTIRLVSWLWLWMSIKSDPWSMLVAVLHDVFTLLWTSQKRIQSSSLPYDDVFLPIFCTQVNKCALIWINYYIVITHYYQVIIGNNENLFLLHMQRNIRICNSNKLNTILFHTILVSWFTEVTPSGCSKCSNM